MKNKTRKPVWFKVIQKANGVEFSGGLPWLLVYYKALAKTDGLVCVAFSYN